MAQAKTNRNSKTQNRYYVVKTVQKTREQVTDTIDDYRQAYIEKPIKSGKAFVSDLKKAPQKTLTGLLDDGKEMITDLNSRTRERISDLVKEGKTFLTKAGKDPRQTAVDVWDDGVAKVDDLQKDVRSQIEDLKKEYRAAVKGLGRDTRLVLDDLLETGKDVLDNVPGKQRIEREINSRIQSLPGRFDLPTKKEIQNLKRRVTTLNKKVDTLKKSIAA